MNNLIPLFAAFTLSSYPNPKPGIPCSEREQFKAKAREIARGNRLPLKRRIRSALLHLLPAGLSAIVTSRQNERHLLLEFKRLEELSSHLLLDIGYRRTLSGEYVLDTSLNGKASDADPSPAPCLSHPADASMTVPEPEHCPETDHRMEHSNQRNPEYALG